MKYPFLFGADDKLYSVELLYSTYFLEGVSYLHSMDKKTHVLQVQWGEKEGVEERKQEDIILRTLFTPVEGARANLP